LKNFCDSQATLEYSSIFYNRGKRVATWCSRCAKVFMPPRILYRSQVQCVCLFFYTDKKKQMWFL